MTETPLRYRLMLAAIPLILVVSIILALIWYVNRTEDRAVPLTGEVTVESMEGNLIKLLEYVGPRTLETEEGRRNILAVMAMVDGSLGEANTGYEVFRNRGEEAHGRLWPCLWVDRGTGGEVAVFQVPLDDEGAAIAMALALAESAGEVPSGETLRVVFFAPQLGDGEVWERVKGRGEELKRTVSLKHEDIVGSDGKKSDPAKLAQRLSRILPGQIRNVGLVP